MGPAVHSQVKGSQYGYFGVLKLIFHLLLAEQIRVMPPDMLPAAKIVKKSSPLRAPRCWTFQGTFAVHLW
jgi:hypothetical protein